MNSNTSITANVIAVVITAAALSILAGCSQNNHDTSMQHTPVQQLTVPEPLPVEQPWPFEFHHPGMSRSDAIEAQLIVGVDVLSACTNVIVTGTTEPAIVVVRAIQPDGLWGFWYVDLSSNSQLVGFTVLSADLETMAVQDMGSGVIFDAKQIEDSAMSSSSRNQLMLAADALGIDPYAKNLWNRIKDKWNSMNGCEQLHLVGGLAVCTVAGAVGGPWTGLACGVGVWVSSTYC